MTQPELSLGEIERIVAGHHHDPHSVLGAHPGPDGVVIRALRPQAKSVTAVLDDGRRLPMTHVHKGVFAVTVPDEKVPGYRIAATYPGSEFEEVRDDPYRYLPTLGEFDLYLIGEGRHEELWRVLGAHVREIGQATGTSFAVWAPNAHGVRVTGDFNYWDGTAYPMRSLGGSGVWELFVPGVTDGAKYKYAICGADGVWREKADPMANAAERPPATASVVYTSRYTWNDRDWVTARAEREPVREPMSIYEVHLGSWRPGLSYRELATQLVDYVTDLGFTHVEFLPVAEHPFGGSWGYQVTSYYAPTARFGSPDDFRYLVDALHQAGIGVHPGLGARALPAGRMGAGAVRRHPAVRAFRPAPRRAARLGHARLQLRAHRGAQFPGRQRRLLAGGIPRRRAARRRGGVHVVPGLLAQGRRVDTQPVRRPGKPGRRSRSCKRSTPPLISGSPASR